MKDGALLVNVSRGPWSSPTTWSPRSGPAGSAPPIDVADREPLPADSPLWTAPNLLDLAARRRRQQRDVAARQPAGARPAAPVRRR